MVFQRGLSDLSSEIEKELSRPRTAAFNCFSLSPFDKNLLKIRLLSSRLPGRRPHNTKLSLHCNFLLMVYIIFVACLLYLTYRTSCFFSSWYKRFFFSSSSEMKKKRFHEPKLGRLRPAVSTTRVHITVCPCSSQIPVLYIECRVFF